MDIENCSKCGELYLRNPLRDVCERCYKEEEEKFEIAYKFLRQRKNRAATVQMITKSTDIEEELLYKWIRKGRLQKAQFPNIGYPCNECGAPIASGELCEDCIDRLNRELSEHNEREERKQSYESIYHAKRHEQK